MQSSILTADGHYFNFESPENCHINIETIAHALSNICRFTGHVKRFYSVAQHSVLVSHLVPPAYAMQGLLHDAAEAYIGDVASPLKNMLPDYRIIEERVEAAVLGHFGLPIRLHSCVKYADLQALATEQLYLLPEHNDTPWECIKGIESALYKVIPLSPQDAKRQFLNRFYELKVSSKDSNETEGNK